MTIQEIAKLCGKGETTVRRWASSAKMADVRAKMAEAKSSKLAASFTPAEVVSIVRSGGNEALASLLEDQLSKRPAPALGAANDERILRLVEAVTELVRDTRGMIGRTAAAPGPADPAPGRALPAVDNRACLGRLMRRYGTQLKKDGHPEPYAGAWYRLCDALHDRAGGFDVSAIAKRTGETRLDVIARSQYLSLAVDIAEYLLAEPGRRALSNGIG